MLIIISGYRRDSFLKIFRTNDEGVVKQSARSAAINRGYLARLIAVENSLEKFLLIYSHIQKCQHQVLSLGAGYDTLYFRLRNQGVVDTKYCRYFEVDFPIVAKTKSHFIHRNLNQFFTKCMAASETFEFDGVFSLIGCNLTQVQEMESKLESCKFDWSKPTFILTECSLTYVDVKDVTNILGWLSRKLSHFLLVDYEQIQPFDAFGQIMVDHFSKRNSPLKCIHTYHSIDLHRKRFENLGLTTIIHTISEIMSHFKGPNERKIALSVDDQFDEYEELQLKCSHYILLLASNSNPMLQDLNLSQSCPPPKRSYFDLHQTMQLKPLKTDPICSRFGHRCWKWNKHIYLFGGYSQTSFRDNVIVKLTEDLNIVERATFPENHTMHAGLAVCSSGLAYVFGGRASPNQSGNSLYKINSDLQCDKIVSVGDMPEPRWRHTLSSVNDQTLVLIGGKTTVKVFGDIWTFNTQESAWKRVANLPCPLHSHSASVMEDQIVLFGGLTDVEEVWENVCIIDTVTWTVNVIGLPESVIPRFSHTSHIRGNKLVLVGGVSNAVTQPGISVLEFNPKRTGFEKCIEMKVESDKSLLIQHSSLMEGQHLTVIGGGSNCFSFGMHVNRSAFESDLEAEQ